MALNPQYDAIGKGFVQQYYALFDNPAQRPNLGNMYNVNFFLTPAERMWGPFLKFVDDFTSSVCSTYDKSYVTGDISAELKDFLHVETSFMTFEGVQLQGSIKIMEKLNSLMFQKIDRIVTAVDSQPMFDGGVIINVLGRLKCDDDPPHAYNQTFVLKPLGDSFFVQHDIFRLSIHDAA